MGTIAQHIPAVIGHQWAIELLQKQQHTGHPPHALLITGPAHVGKSTVGRFIAQSLTCQNENKPCGQCTSCRKIYSGNHPDIRFFDDDEPIKIDQVRDIQRSLSLSPVESNYRVTLLCNFERATTAAANALLKTLEEPASNVILILTAIEASRLLPTINSRCQLLNLRTVPQQLLLDALQTEWHAAPEQAELLTRLSGGRPGWAIRALSDDVFLAERQQRLQEMVNLLYMSRAKRLAYTQNFGRDPAQLKIVLALWLTLWRDLLLLKSGSQAPLINIDWHEALRPVAAHITLAQVHAMIIQLRNRLHNLERNVNPRLILDITLLKLPKLKHSA